MELCELSFALYNNSSNGQLRKDEMKELYLSIYDCEHHDEKMNYLFGIIAYQKESASVHEYLFHLAEVPELVTPFFTLRDKLRKVILGAKFWKKIEPQAYL